MENSEIIWAGSPDDMTAKSGDYVLRVELMDEYWWWSCSIEHDKDSFSEFYGDRVTIEAAKTAAINAMKEHKDGKH